jgi:hypothetical protein
VIEMFSAATGALTAGVSGIYSASAATAAGDSAAGAAEESAAAPSAAESVRRRITTLLVVFADASFSGFFPERRYARSLSASISEIALK